MKKMTFFHIGLTCRHPLVIEKFYRKHFGFKRARVFSPGPEQIVMLKSGDVYLELFKATEEAPVPEARGNGPSYPGWRHICFAVNDLDILLKEMGQDARITLGPLQRDELIPGMKVCWIADPEGNIIELNQGYTDEAHPLPFDG
ncbi:MAG: VOC family protein [Deltaproteobacteria bacterium]|nr:VOC family protein [Deltaproteobacteria bacterium]